MKVMRQVQHTIIILLVMAIPAVTVFGADCTPPAVQKAEEATAALDDLRSVGCLGGVACSAELCKKIQSFTEKWCVKDTGEFCKLKTIDKALFSEAGELLGALEGKVESLPPNGTAVPQLRGMMGRWQDAFKSIETRPVGGTRITEWDTGGMRLFPDTIYMIDMEKAFAASCGTPAECRGALDSAREAYTEAALTHRVLAVLAGGDVQQAFEHIKQLDARWHAYHNDTRAIYPWEMCANGYLVHESPVKGFAEPPNKQILFLHPSAGFEYRFSGNDRLQEAILLDVIGFYRWRWGGKEEAEIKRPWGLAVAASYDGVEPSYGVTAHFPKNWSLGVGVDRHGKVSLSLNADFGNYLLNKKKSVDKLKDKFL
jgi:hypothetical protein